MSDTPKQPEIEPYYQKQGQDVVDMLHDNKIINPELSRDDLRMVEDYIAYLFQAHANTAAKVSVMLEQLKNNKRSRTNV